MEGSQHALPVGLAIPVDEKRPLRQGQDVVPARGHARRVITGAWRAKGTLFTPQHAPARPQRSEHAQA
jgi:hypothetical protein